MGEKSLVCKVIELEEEVTWLRDVIEATYKAHTGRDFMHLPLPEAVGAVIGELYDEVDRYRAALERISTNCGCAGDCYLTANTALEVK